MLRGMTIALLGFIFCADLNAQDDWPKEIPLSSGGKVIIYQPQPESLSGNVLSSRAAVSVREKKNSEPVFGAVWSEAQLLTNLDSRMATLESIKITDVRFPNVTDETKIQQFRDLLEREIPAWNLELSIDNIIATLEEGADITEDNLNTAPPKIIYTSTPSTLVLIDGDPKIENNKDAGVDLVVNSPFLILKNPEDKKFYLFGGDYWYQSTAIASGWTPVTRLSGKMAEIDKAVREQQPEDDQKAEKPSSPPAIVVSTEPAELIQSDGEPDFQSIEGTGLLYMANTDDQIFMNISEQTYYVLLAGRWYNSKSMNGPWTYSEPDELPEDFQKIPDGSDKDVVLASVAGTDEAREARLDAQIPQTAKVDINSTDCTVEYDGKPKFEPIEGTSLQVAVNTSSTVLMSGNSYYPVEDGVWFKSNNPEGPWKVSTERPSDVEDIPATSPAYNTKYVYIYDVTPSYVYMGYTPGYLGSYVYGPTVVYGTGYYYRPWYGAYYYPRPVTWGFGMHYNPWTGWNMSFGYSTGWFSFSWGYGGGYYRGGWWGPPVYRPPYRPPYRGGYYGPRRNVNIDNSTNINIGSNNRTKNLYNNRGDAVTRDRTRPASGDRTRPSTTDRTRPTSRDNARPTTNDRTRPATSNQRPTTREATRPSTKPQAKPATRERNNVYTDKQGNVYRQQNNGNWQQRNSSGWSQPSQSNRSNLNRQSTQRSRGQTRTSNYQSRPSARPAARPAGRRGN